MKPPTKPPIDPKYDPALERSYERRKAAYDLLEDVGCRIEALCEELEAAPGVIEDESSIVEAVGQCVAQTRSFSRPPTAPTAERAADDVRE